MDMLEWVRESRHGSWLISTAAYLIAIGGALYLRRSAGESGPVELVGALLMAVALIVTALVMRSPVYPRWSLITAAGVLGAGMIGPLLIAPAPAGSNSPIGTWGYGWLYLMLLGTTRVGGPRWCHSPWAMVAGAGVLALIESIALVVP